MISKTVLSQIPASIDHNREIGGSICTGLPTAVSNSTASTPAFGRGHSKVTTIALVAPEDARGRKYKMYAYAVEKTAINPTAAQTLALDSTS